MNRREFVTTLATASAIGIGAGEFPAQSQTQRQMKPLPFDPAKLRGLSERLLRSHHENNYGGALRRLGQIEAQIAQLPKDAPGFQVKGLKMEELIATNSVILHEEYFGNLGGDGKASGSIQNALEVPRARYRALDRSYFPRFRLQSGFSSRGTGARPDGSLLGGLNGLVPSTGNWGVGFSVHFPIFDLPIVRERQRIESELERAETARYDEIVQSLQADAARARARLESARQIAASTPVQLGAARATEQQSRARYQAGLATIIEVTCSAPADAGGNRR